MSDRQLTPEELDAKADELLKKYNKGELEAGETVVEQVEEGPEDDTTEPAGEDASSGSDGAGDGEDGKDAEKDGEKDGAVPKEPVEGDGEEEAGGEPEGDELQGLRLENAANRIKNAQRRMHSATTKEAETRRENEHLKELLAKSQQVATDLQAPVTPDNADDDVVELSDSELAELNEGFPSLAKVFNNIASTQRENKALRHRLSKVEGRQNKSESDRGEESFMGTILDAHDDAVEIQNAPEFYGWVDLQPRYVQKAVYDGCTAEDMVNIIWDYKADIGPEVESGEEPAPEPEKELTKLEQAKAAATPTLSKKGQARQHKPGKGDGPSMSRQEIQEFNADIQNRTPEEIEAFEKRMDAANVAGRIY